MRTTLQITSMLMASALLGACSPESATLSTVTPVTQPTPPVYEKVQPLPQPERPEYDKVSPLPAPEKPEFDKVGQLPTPEKPEFEKVQEQKSAWITEDGGQSQLDFNPQVDILFITDNSDSMKSAQNNLVRNIDRFTDGIVKNKMIDYHIGVISTWDSSERFVKTKKDPYGIGELRYIKDSTKTFGQRYITKNEKALMASTLEIGVAAYADGGPENEEFFSPLVAALEKTGRGAANEGFFRPEAQLVVVIMTDADDSNSNIGHEQVVSRLVQFKNGRKEKVSVYGVLVNAKDPDQYKDWALKIHPKYNPQCFDKKGKQNGTCAKGIGPDRLEQFIVAANSDAGTSAQIRAKYIMSIVSKNFGSDLAKIGSDIQVKTLAKEIFLSQIPVVKDGLVQVRVRYGTQAELDAGKGQLIPNSLKGGWLYSPEANSVRLSGDINYNYKENARFAVDLMPVILK